jgi:hypothetical protein
VAASHVDVSVALTPPDDKRWFLLWREGGEILLMHSSGRGGLGCPKCEAPMLFTAKNAVCYACGATYRSTDGVVIRPYGRHRWTDADCGRYMAYDPRKGLSWYQNLDPGDVDPCGA